MILGLGIPEILVILVVVLVIFGPKNDYANQGSRSRWE